MVVQGVGCEFSGESGLIRFGSTGQIWVLRPRSATTRWEPGQGTVTDLKGAKYKNAAGTSRLRSRGKECGRVERLRLLAFVCDGAECCVLVGWKGALGLRCQEGKGVGDVPGYRVYGPTWVGCNVDAIVKDRGLSVWQSGCSGTA